jgi:hypothetical protein
MSHKMQEMLSYLPSLQGTIHSSWWEQGWMGSTERERKVRVLIPRQGHAPSDLTSLH